MKKNRNNLLKVTNDQSFEVQSFDKGYNQLVFKTLQIFEGALMQLHEAAIDFGKGLTGKKKIVKINKLLKIFEYQKEVGPYMSEGFRMLAETYIKELKEAK